MTSSHIQRLYVFVFLYFEFANPTPSLLPLLFPLFLCVFWCLHTEADELVGSAAPLGSICWSGTQQCRLNQHLVSRTPFCKHISSSHWNKRLLFVPLQKSSHQLQSPMKLRQSLVSSQNSTSPTSSHSHVKRSLNSLIKSFFFLRLLGFFFHSVKSTKIETLKQLVFYISLNIFFLLAKTLHPSAAALPPLCHTSQLVKRFASL